MRIVFTLTLGFGLLLFSSCKNVNDPENVTEKPTIEEFKEYHGYIYKGERFSTNDTTLVYHFFNKSSFDEVFHALITPTRADTIPRTDFAVKEILAVMKYGNNEFKMKVDTVERLKEVLSVKYSCDKIDSNLTFIEAIPMIITTKGGYSLVKFIENGKLVKVISWKD